MAEPILRVDAVSKRFGGLLAVDRVSFAADAGRITALIGPNGAGKTTLFAIVSGFLPPSAGRIFYAGSDITGEPPQRLARRGIARTFQIVQPRSAHTCRGRRVRTRSRPRPRSHARSGSATCSTGPLRALPCPTASGSNWRGRSPSSRSSSCSTRCWLGSIRPRSATWCR